MKPARLATAVVLATTGGLLTALATTPASAAASCTSPAYKRQFFANTTFSGTPQKTDCDTAVSENWGTGAPASGLPANNFGVRWTVTRDFGSGGPFTFSVSAQDGVRVYLDGVRKLDVWRNVSTTVKKNVNLTVPQGSHTVRVDYVNWTGGANVKFAYTPRTSVTVDKVAPLTPTGLAVAYDGATGHARLNWTRNKEMDLAGHRVYRRPADGSTWTRLASTTSTTYTDTTLPLTGAAYVYTLRAYDTAGNESAGTAPRTVSTADRTAPAVPQDLDVRNGFTSLNVSWTAVADASSYRVLRAMGANGTYTAVATVTSPAYADTDTVEGSTYSYRVTALDAAGNESARSSAVAETRWDSTAPDPVTGLTATPTGYGFHLTWDANPTPDLSRYVVHRGEFHGDEEERVCVVHEVKWLSADTTSYDYATLPDGEEACLLVDAVDDNGLSTWRWTGKGDIVTATELDVTPGVETPEGSPLSLTAEAAEGDEGNQLTWEGLDDSDPLQANGYRVLRWNPRTSAYEPIAELPSGTRSYTDTTASRGTTSFYWVTALSTDGTQSAPAADWTATAP
ncbi:PA14 domain-containing protein [Streptomyces sp. DSM 15324]|uniref:PA14 domain-containing protein n=1 Tax=Streptomyces sp. DSM 15324 TaxID=1739111 RepID=UPI00074ADFF3|nr:PA14 domain-containing protein [Streptomyces sp. DSM 15324]KUO08106.1 cellulose 1,4-beta-cellobiosidase [Streptomyces sp. DSM 15324]